MIRLAKTDQPGILAENGPEWTAEYVAARAAGGEIPDRVRFRYRHPDVKSALRAEARDKCIYCETKVATGETDHILPVKERPDLICEWNNLGLCCRECNGAKGSYYGPTEPLINPFVQDPQDHLLFFGPVVLHRDDMGLRTRMRLDLSRPDLVERRSAKLESLMPLIDRWRAQPAGETKTLLWNLVEREASPESEYSALVRSYLLHEFGVRVGAGSVVPEAA